MADEARTVGVEEELLLVDPTTGETVSRSRAVVARAGGDRSGAVQRVGTELYQHQLETRTEPARDLGELRDCVVAARAVAGEAASQEGLATAAAGVAPLAGPELQVTPDDRYRDMVATFGEITRAAGTCGLHVHVGIDSPEEGVAVIDRVAPWLPVLLAVSANSPYSEGRDTSYASWRSQAWSRWPSAGPTEAFGSLAGYRAVCAAMKETGAARDDGMLYFDARLSPRNPTVEIRVADVCTDPDDTLLLAALARALADHAATTWRRGESAPAWRCEQLRAAHWRAARYGLTGKLVDPTGGDRLVPAAEVLARLLQLVRPELERADDLELVVDGTRRVLAGGGATAQRAAYERSGELVAVVRDLVERTERCWRGRGA